MLAVQVVLITLLSAVNYRHSNQTTEKHTLKTYIALSICSSLLSDRLSLVNLFTQ